MKTHTDVLICGAGATGLVLALDLARRGIPFLLVDKLARPFHGSRGKGLQPRSLEIFEALGVLDRLAAAGGPYPRYAGTCRMAATSTSRSAATSRTPLPRPPSPTGCR
ncbi:FAD-dependent monooxygenase [Pseudoxanthomonas suwonensis]